MEAKAKGIIAVATIAINWATSPATAIAQGRDNRTVAGVEVGRKPMKNAFDAAGKVTPRRSATLGSTGTGEPYPPTRRR